MQQVRTTVDRHSLLEDDLLLERQAFDFERDRFLGRRDRMQEHRKGHLGKVPFAKVGDGAELVWIWNQAGVSQGRGRLPILREVASDCSNLR